MKQLKKVYLEITNLCNLCCAFCPGTRRAKGFLTPADFQTLAARLRPHTEYLYLHLMGEPLLHPQLGELLELAAAERFQVCLTTNGVLLNDENIQYINREMSNAVLSLDGRPEVNDRMRKTVAGGGSYEAILPKFQKLVEARGEKDYYLRGTFTRYNPDFAADVIHIADQGFRHASVEPVVTKRVSAGAAPISRMFSASQARPGMCSLLEMPRWQWADLAPISST